MTRSESEKEPSAIGGGAGPVSRDTPQLSVLYMLLVLTSTGTPIKEATFKKS